MSRAHTAVPQAEAPDLQAAAAVVRAHGLRLSTSRRLVLEALYRADEPLTAEQIAGELDIASVYRNLEALEEIGLVRHVHLGHGPGLYARTLHEYLLCERCGTVRTVELDDVRALVRERFGFEARFTHFPISGLCASCAAEDG